MGQGFRSALLPAALALALAGSAAAKAPKPLNEAKIERTKVSLMVEDDRFTGMRATFPSKQYQLEGTGLFETVHVRPVFGEHPEGVSRLYLRTRYVGMGWAFLNGTIHLLIDGKTRIKLTGPDSAREREVLTCSNVGCHNMENLTTPITREQLQALARARTAEIRIEGSKASIQGRFREQHIAGVRALLAALPEEGSITGDRRVQPLTDAEQAALMDLKPTD